MRCFKNNIGEIHIVISHNEAIDWINNPSSGGFRVKDEIMVLLKNNQEAPKN